MATPLSDFYNCLYTNQTELDAFLEDPKDYVKGETPGTCTTQAGLSDEQKNIILSGDADLIEDAIREETGTGRVSGEPCVVPTILVKI